MTANPHFPIRTCIGCGGRSPKADLLRVARDASGRVVSDGLGRVGGRGGYLHRSSTCWSEFARRKGPVRSLRTNLDRAARAALIEALQVGLGD